MKINNLMCFLFSSYSYQRKSTFYGFSERIFPSNFNFSIETKLRNGFSYFHFARIFSWGLFRKTSPLSAFGYLVGCDGGYRCRISRNVLINAEQYFIDQHYLALDGKLSSLHDCFQFLDTLSTEFRQLISCFQYSLVDLINSNTCIRVT